MASLPSCLICVSRDGETFNDSESRTVHYSVDPQKTSVVSNLVSSIPKSQRCTRQSPKRILETAFGRVPEVPEHIFSEFNQKLAAGNGDCMFRSPPSCCRSTEVVLKVWHTDPDPDQKSKGCDCFQLPQDTLHCETSRYQALSIRLLRHEIQSYIDFYRYVRRHKARIQIVDFGEMVSDPIAFLIWHVHLLGEDGRTITKDAVFPI